MFCHVVMYRPASHQKWMAEINVDVLEGGKEHIVLWIVLHFHRGLGIGHRTCMGWWYMKASTATSNVFLEVVHWSMVGHRSLIICIFFVTRYPFNYSYMRSSSLSRGLYILSNSITAKRQQPSDFTSIHLLPLSSCGHILSLSHGDGGLKGLLKSCPPALSWVASLAARKCMDTR